MEVLSGQSLSSSYILTFSTKSAFTDFHQQVCQRQCGRRVSYHPQSANISLPARKSPFTEQWSVRKSRGKGLFLESLSEGSGHVCIERDDVHGERKRPVEFNVGNNVFGSPRCSFEPDSNSIPRGACNGQLDNYETWKIGCSLSETPSNSVDDLLEDNNLHEDITVRLPELRDVLGLLRARWAEEAAFGKRRYGPGNVYLVGTGPGDPELLTVKALRLMQNADLVLYDRLVSIDILDMVHPGARLLYVGKTSGYHSRTQEEIHELLLSFSEAGATVLRLKGGDPLVFGRGGEEMDFLQEQGISVQVVPGITAASGIAAQLGIPLTQRGVANSVRFFTGHSRKGGDDPLYVVGQAVDPDSTLVIYMGLANLAAIAAKLIANGLSPNTPAVAVERGTTVDQRMIFSILEDLPRDVAAAQLVSPTLIIIGQVVVFSPLWPHKTTFSCSGQVMKPRAVDVISKGNLTAGKDLHDRHKRGHDPLLPSQL